MAGFVSKPSWSVGTSGDYLSGGRAGPFIFTAAEGSYERQIDLRTSGGAGAKYRFINNERTRLDVSLAALLDRTTRVPEGASSRRSRPLAGGPRGCGRVALWEMRRSCSWSRSSVRTWTIWMIVRGT
jgi:hypothetical protein